MTKLSSLSGFVAVGALAVLAGSAATAFATGGGGGGSDSGTPVNERSLASLARPAGLAIGVAVSTDYLADSAEYKAIVDREFSSITAENVMKWEALEPEPGVYTYEKADGLIAYAAQTHKAVRGHTLVWHNQNPAWVNETDLTPAELRAASRST